MFDQDTGARGQLALTHSVIERNHDIGVQIAGSDAKISATVVRDTDGRADGLFGEGILVGHGAVVDVSDSLVARSREGGVVVSGSTLTLVSSVVTDTAMNAAGHLGGGIGARAERGYGAAVHPDGRELGRRQEPPGRDLRERLRRDRRADGGPRDRAQRRRALRPRDPGPDRLGHRGARERVGEGLPRREQPRDGDRGRRLRRRHRADAGPRDARERRGQAGRRDHDRVEGGPASATIVGTRVESSARAALSSFGASITFGANVFDCNGFDLEGEEFGGASFAFDHTGGNVCGCTSDAAIAGECQVQSAGLEPPTVAGLP